MKINFLNALQAFEAACRSQSFSIAAEELNVTSAAVGQLVRNLEEWLGKPLFIRHSGGKTRLTPTPLALQVLPDVQKGFDYLGNALQQLKENNTDNSLTVSVPSALASKWLLPKLEQFQKLHPEVDLLVNMTSSTPTQLAENIALAVFYGNGNWPGLIAEPWLSETLFPVCSPAFLAQHQINSPEDLLVCPLIHDISMPSETGFLGWKEWFAHQNIQINELKGLKINNSAAVLQSAMDSQGIALARTALVQDDLAYGRLIRLFPEISCISALTYYLVYRPACIQLDKIRKFKTWLESAV